MGEAGELIGGEEEHQEGPDPDQIPGAPGSYWGTRLHQESSSKGS